MCGIAGIIGRINDASRSALQRMATAMAHRGPDSAGFWTGTPDAAGNGCLLAHRRLSILDLSAAADQPMIDPASGKVIVFNGEIYNYRALRDELQQSGQSFQSSGDTAVMLRALSMRGHRACAALRGMFAFALWDDRTRELMLGRDPLGIKPLYLCHNPNPEGDWSFLFASEVRSILASGLLERPRLDPAAVVSVVWNGFVMGPGTIVRGVEQLRPGQILIRDGRGHGEKKEFFWQIPPPSTPADGPANEEPVRHALRESIRLHLASDVPLGVFLSGGIDSGAVANLAQKASDRPINTFTLAFEEQSLNEGRHARKIAEAIGTQHREILLTERDFIKNLDRAIDTLDQPTFDGLNSFYMAHAVREAGLTVALAGTGGDELFGGYKSFREIPKLLAMARRTGFVPNGLKIAAARWIKEVKSPSRGKNVGPQTRWAKLPDMVGHGDNLIGLYQLAYALFLPDFQRQLLTEGLADGQVIDGLPLSMLDRLELETAGRSDLSAISVLEQRCFLGERLLRDTDAASMAVSLELRVPLVDQTLVETINGIDDDLRYQPLGRKAMLRRIGLEGLDPALFERPKSGFVLPFDQWIRRNLGKEMDETMRDAGAFAQIGLNGSAVGRLWQSFQQDAPGMYWSRVWALYILIRWCRRHCVMMA